MSSSLRVLKIRVFAGSGEDRDALFQKAIRVIRQNHRDVLETDEGLRVSVDKILCQLSLERAGDLIVLKSMTKYEDDLGKAVEGDLQSFDPSNSVLALLSSSPLSTFTILSPMIKDEKLVEDSVVQFSRYFGKPSIGIGIIRGCAISILESGAGEEELFDRYYLVSPLHPEKEITEKRYEEALEDIKLLAIHAAELSRLYSGCKSFFSALKPGEMEISSKIEDFLWRLIGPEPVELGKLESWLSYVMERENTLSSMITTMRVNTLEARSIVSDVESIFQKLNERSFKDYPRNSEIDLASYHKTAKLFEDYVDRVEALKERLETVMDQIRTYLSLQQQKLTMDEQKASKEQLVRLVNLQEIFHKVEIFIVAVYITEMARTVFEALIHEEAGLATAFFIPVALLLAIAVSRILHRE